MKQFHDVLEVFLALAEILGRPNSNFVSISQLCRRHGISDDLARRALAKVDEKFHGPMIAVINHRLGLTSRGRTAGEVLRKLYALAENGQYSMDILTFECTPWLAETVLPRALPTFLEVFGGMMGLRLCDLEIAAIGQNIAAHHTDAGFGLVSEDEEAQSGKEVLDAEIPWVVLIPHGHRLQEGAGSIAGTDLRPDDRIFLPKEAETLPSLRQWISGVESAYRVECESLNVISRMAAAGLGLGVFLDLGFEPIGKGLAVRPLAGVKAQKLCFYLPRRANELSEPALVLIDAIRKVIESRITTDSASAAATPLGNGPVAVLVETLEEPKS